MTTCKAKAFLDYEITASDIVTIDMITWVRDNFVMDSLIDGVPRGIMPPSKPDHDITLSFPVTQRSSAI